MIRGLLVLILVHSVALAQNELKDQIEAIQGLLPSATSCVILWNPKSNPEYESLFGVTSSETGLRIIQTPVESPRELSGVIKALTPYNPDFILLLSDRVVTGKNAVRFVCKAYHKKSVPVFGSGEDVLRGGAYGELAFAGGKWKIKINGEIRGEFRITPPEGDDRYSVAY